MLGAILKATGILKPEEMKEALDKRFGRIAEKNFNALKTAFETTFIQESA